MNQINKVQEEFFTALRELQEFVVVEALNKTDANNNMESVFYDITSETICEIMVLIDGYFKENLQLDLIDKKSGESLRAGIELHDKCVDYLK